MRIKRLVLSDFGKFHEQEFTVSAGLNIATGANESGKTTLRRFVRSMLYGLERERGLKARKDDYIRYKPWNYGRFQGFLEFESEGKNYRLFRNFLTTEKEVSLTELATGKELLQPMEFLRQQGLVAESIFTNTFWVGNICTTEDLLAAELKDYLANLAYSGGAGLNLQKSLNWLARQKKEVAKQLPEQELSDCMALRMDRERIKEQLNRGRYRLEANLRRQRELEDMVQMQRRRAEQLAAERREAELEEKKKFQGEWLLTLLCMLAAGLGGIACVLPTLQWRLVGWCGGLVLFLCGLAVGIPLIKRGRAAGMRRTELEIQSEENAKQLEEQYQELTRLLPGMEQDKLHVEQMEEQLGACETAEERYALLKSQKEALQKKEEAFQLAADTLTKLSAELYEEFGARFATSLSEYARAFTDHAYETLTADEGLKLKAVTGERSLEISEVSFGTGEQLYLALRFAAADVFDPEKRLPVILDDSFASFDEQRLESAVLALAQCGRQVLVFSSTGREELAAKRMGITYEAIF